MLNKLHIEEFTKSRPRRSNDNALARISHTGLPEAWGEGLRV